MEDYSSDHESNHTEKDWPLLHCRVSTSKSKPKARLSAEDSHATRPVDPGPSKRLQGEKLRKALDEECAKEQLALLKSVAKNAYKPPDFVNKYLEQHDIIPLQKRSQKFPKALYYCRLCDYYCERLSICVQHVGRYLHSRLEKIHEVDTTLFHLPKPTKHHLENLEQLLHKVEREHALSRQDLQKRQAIAAKLTTLLSVDLPNCNVCLFGSSLSGFGLKDSNCNLYLQMPSDFPAHISLVSAYRALLASKKFQNVKMFVAVETPYVSFELDQINCELSVNNYRSLQTSFLLRDYYNLDPRVATLSAAVRLWARMCSIDRKLEGTLPAHTFAIMLIFFLQQGKQPLLPCIHDQVTRKDLDTYEAPTEFLATYKSPNIKSVAELWIEFFEFYSLGFTMNGDVVNIRNVSSGRSTKRMKGRLCIEDPYCSSRSLTRSINSRNTLDFIMNCFKIAYLYFGTVQTTQGPTVTKVLAAQKAESSSSSSSSSVDASVDQFIKQVKLSNVNITGAVSCLPSSKVISMEELESTFAELGNRSSKGRRSDTDRTPHREERLQDVESFESFRKKFGTVLTPKQAQRVAEIVPKNMILFRFDQDILTAGQSPDVYCGICDGEDHFLHTCPDLARPLLTPLPPISAKYKAALNNVCEDLLKCWAPSADELAERDAFIMKLTEYIRKFYPTSKLTLFGSSCNGFAIKRSDLDLCLTFSDHPKEQFIASKDIIPKLAQRLKKMDGIVLSRAITSARVPIVKFSHKAGKIDGDISLYNLLAQENTKMLRTYSMIDIRVKKLGYMVKVLAKQCNIGQAAKGSLSSYAYILMMIYYLQQCQPPVVPVLQELHDEDEKPEQISHGWNVWFFSDISRLAEVWPGLGRNTQSVGELWIGFLEFYVKTFDIDSLVVSIRQKRPLTKLEKMWNLPCIAIEDPFDLSHNLGSPLFRKMDLYIKKCFIKCREHFGIPPPHLDSFNVRQLQHYLFDPKALTEGPPPVDRECMACGRYGHMAESCPGKRKKRDKAGNHQQRDGPSGRIAEAQQSTLRPAAVVQSEVECSSPPPGEDSHFKSLLAGLGFAAPLDDASQPTLYTISAQPRLPDYAIKAQDLEKLLVPPASANPTSKLNFDTTSAKLELSPDRSSTTTIPERVEFAFSANSAFRPIAPPPGFTPAMLAGASTVAGAAEAQKKTESWSPGTPISSASFYAHPFGRLPWPAAPPPPFPSSVPLMASLGPVGSSMPLNTSSRPALYSSPSSSSTSSALFIHFDLLVPDKPWLQGNVMHQPLRQPPADLFGTSPSGMPLWPAEPQGGNLNLDPDVSTDGVHMRRLASDPIMTPGHLQNNLMPSSDQVAAQFSHYHWKP